MHSFDDDPAARQHATQRLLRLLGDKALQPHISERVPLAEASRAHALLEAGSVIGKIVLKP